MKQFLLLSTCVFLISCSGPKQKSTDQHLLLKASWLVVSVNEQELSIDPEKDGLEIPRLEILMEEMRYSGSDGCNQFMGGLIELDENTLKFGIAAGTRRMCMEMAIPDLINSSLPLVNSYEIKEDVLRLFKANGDELMLLKKAL